MRPSKFTALQVVVIMVFGIPALVIWKQAQPEPEHGKVVAAAPAAKPEPKATQTPPTYPTGLLPIKCYGSQLYVTRSGDSLTRVIMDHVFVSPYLAWAAGQAVASVPENQVGADLGLRQDQWLALPGACLPH